MLDAGGKPISASTNITTGPHKKLNKSFSEPALDKYDEPTQQDAGMSLNICFVVEEYLSFLLLKMLYCLRKKFTLVFLMKIKP